MLTSVIEEGVAVGAYPELAGKRVLITGLDLTSGVDVARSFAEQGCRIVLHLPDTGAEADAVLEMLSATAEELQVYNEPLADMDAAVRFAQTAAKAFGGLDAVVNLIRFEPNKADASGDVERTVADQLQNACLITRIAANRMRLTWSEGLILNVLTCPTPDSRQDAAILGLARYMLTSMTRTEAQQWAEHAIRINAVAPSTEPSLSSSSLSSEPDVAALALYLASQRGRELSGLVFDLEHAALPTIPGLAA